jgi:membrane dipeptidase
MDRERDDDAALQSALGVHAAPALRLAIDAHADTAQRILDLGESFSDETSRAEVSLHKARAGGLAAQFFSIWVDPLVFPGDAAWPRARRLVDAVHAEVARAPCALALARTGADVRALAARGVFAILLGVEGAHALGADGEPIETRRRRLRELAAAGVRYLACTWSNSNDFAGSSGDAGRSRGLTPLGHDLVELLLELDILLDVSHVSDATFGDLVIWARSASAPLIASHSSARALAAHPRNLTDEQLRAIADTGGVASVNFCPAFLDEAFRAEVTAATATPAARQAQEEARRSERDPGRAALLAWHARSAFARAVPAPGVERLVDHLCHMQRVAGEDHVGLGSDFDGTAAVPAGLENVSLLPRLADALLGRGLSARAVDKIFADNWLRVLGD